MNKAMIGAAVLFATTVGSAGCKDSASSSAAAAGADGSPATVDSAGTTTAGSILDKALSFVTGGPFEGTVTMNMTHADQPPKSITYEVKGDKMRFDRPSGPVAGDTGYVIIDGKKFISIDDKKKMAIVLSSDAMGLRGAGAAAAAAKKPVEKTGKMDTVAGYSCEIWKVTQEDGGKTEACIAKGIAFPSIGKPEESWMSELIDQKLFPLRAVTTDATGKEKSRMEVTKIEKKSIDDSQFQIPAGYKEATMQEMLQNMGAMHGMGGHMGHSTAP